MIHWAGALGGPWLLGAFVAGVLSGGRREGALAGALAIVAGTAVYYAIFHFVEGTASLFYAVAAGVGWSVAGAVVGALFGYAGGLWKEGGWPQAIAAGILAGGLLAESALLWQTWEGDSAQRAIVIQAVIAGGLALALSRRVALTASVAAGAFGVLYVGELMVRELLRTSGWAGA